MDNALFFWQIKNTSQSYRNGVTKTDTLGRAILIT